MRLSEKYRLAQRNYKQYLEAVLLYYFFDMNDAEIAKLQNIPRSTVQYRRLELSFWWRAENRIESAEKRNYTFYQYPHITLFLHL